MSEQQSQAATTTATGDRCGDPISEERQRELLDRLQAWQQSGEPSTPEKPKGPFTWQQLNGADVYFLAANALVGTRHDSPDLSAAQALLLRADGKLCSRHRAGRRNREGETR